MEAHRVYLTKHGFDDKEATAMAYEGSVNDERHNRDFDGCCFLFGFIPCLRIVFSENRKVTILPARQS